MKKIINDKKGFTLVELIVAITILSIVLAMASSIFIRASKVQNTIIKRVSYQDAATTIMTMIRSRIKDTNYLTIAENNTDAYANAAAGYGKVYVLNDYDGIYVQNDVGTATKMYGIKDLNNTKLKVEFKCEPIASDGRYSVLTVNMAFYDSKVSNTDITADTMNKKAVYTHNGSIYLQNLAFGIRITNGTIETQKSSDGYSLMSDNEKEHYEKTMMNSNASGFVGQCIKYKKMN